MTNNLYFGQPAFTLSTQMRDSNRYVHLHLYNAQVLDCTKVSDNVHSDRQYYVTVAINGMRCGMTLLCLTDVRSMLAKLDGDHPYITVAVHYIDGNGQKPIVQFVRIGEERIYASGTNLRSVI